MPDGVNIPGGPSFIGLPQPPDVPCDPTGDGWRGPPGPPGPSGVGVFLPLVGGTMTGPIVLPGDPTTALQAASKHYVDQQTAVGTPPGGPFLPLGGGTVTGATTFITAGVGLALTDGVGIGSTRTNFFSPNGTVLDIRDPNVGPLANFVSITANKTGSNPIISVANAGDANTNLQLNAKGTGYLYLGSNVGMPARNTTWAGNFATGQPLLTLNGLMGGVATGDAAAMWLAINDTIDARTGLVHGLNIIHNFGGMLSVGSKTGLNIFLNQTSTTNSLGNITGQIEYSGAIIASRANANDGGTSVNGFGSITGVNIIANAQPGATYYGYLEGLEIDVSANAGSSPHNKLGLAISAAVGDADHGIKTDAGILIKAASSDANIGGFMVGIMFGQQDGNFPVPLGGTLIGTQVISYNAAQGIGARSPNPAYGIDWSKVNFVARSLSFPAFSVSGLGVTSVGAAVLTPTTTGASLDVALQQSSAPTVVAGGHDFVVGDIMFHPSGAQSRVSAVDGTGAITALTQLVPGYSSSPPTGGQILSGGNGQGGQASLTWTLNNTLALQPSGGAVQVGAGCIAANGSVATVLGSLGPVGSHTAVQEWIAVKNASGITRYIPAF